MQCNDFLNLWWNRHKIPVGLSSLFSLHWSGREGIKEVYKVKTEILLAYTFSLGAFRLSIITCCPKIQHKIIHRFNLSPMRSQVASQNIARLASVYGYVSSTRVIFLFGLSLRVLGLHYHCLIWLMSHAPTPPFPLLRQIALDEWLRVAFCEFVIVIPGTTCNY